MKKQILLLHLVLIAACISAQKTDYDYSPVQYKTGTCKSSFEKIKLDGEANAATVERFILSSVSNMKDKRAAVKLNYMSTSPGGFHFSFHQTFEGVEVYQSEIKVNTDKRNMVHSVFDNSENTSGWSVNTSSATENSVIVISPETHLPVLAEKKLEEGNYETLRANGNIVFQRDIRSYFAAPDSLVSGYVFRPDPLTSSQQYYGGMYVDSSDKDQPWLDNERVTVNFKANFVGGLFSLENNIVHVVDFDTPFIPPATSSVPQFYYDRSQSGFEDVNAYYHITTIRQHIDSLGFACAINCQVEIDPHALAGADNSYFNPGTIPNHIFYGTGGVDDAEDADVVVHEYGHAVSENESPTSNSCSCLQRNSLDEGFGDYLAGSYSRGISSFNDEWVFNWDGHNEYWRGRVFNTPKIYPDSLGTSIYHNGEMWSRALMEINHNCGREVCDSLILEAHYSYAQNISMLDAAQLLFDADTLLTGGVHYCCIYWPLRNRGFASPLPNNGSCITNIEKTDNLSIGFAQDGVSFTVYNISEEQLQLSVMNLSGQLIADMPLSRYSFNYRNSDLAAGVYLVQVRAHDTSKTFKWCKAK